MNNLATPELAGTKKALVEAATSLFAEHGFDSVSLRDITGRAEANVASVKYHFGSKEALMDAVVEEMIGPVNVERLKRLSQLKEEGSPSVRDLLCAFHQPLLSRVKGSDLSEQLFCKLMGRLVGERPYQFPSKVMSQFRRVAKGYVPAFQEALPHLTTRDIFWNIHFSFGVVSHTLMHGDLLKKISEGAVGDEELDRTMESVIDFCEAGFTQGGKA
ncbi:MAG: TetR family transcriptional regulator [Akkermansiaceae bacterium]